MQQDPIGLNFYNGTGGYVWQLADYMQHNLNESAQTLELQKPIPPTAINSFAVYPRELNPLAHIQWAKDVQIIRNKPALIGKRQIQPVTAVSTKGAAFGGFDFPTSEVLHEGCLVQSFEKIQFNGSLLAAGSLLISLLRHGLIETDQKAFSENDATALLREPPCRIVDSPLGTVAINQLNGRTIRLHEKTKPLLQKATTEMHLQHPIEQTTTFFIKAGMLRLVKL
ncbi:hypothetical protein [Bartonella grahamii]|uniref:Uncharacterized protein n=2 Tax=Bartonella grahamii TaxID=33045 RepID=A0A336NCD6_BARGR|nr:hypothetical protein [Bartonella grahamii]ACS51718.1 hypothetical protein Bgr_15390 [Bartonella grahamii as4aup]SSZ39203.1 Uncharacterised protein [Bartonella grahamii]